MKQKFKHWPELGPILVYSAVGLAFWALSWMAMAGERRLLGDYLAPCPNYYAADTAFRNEQRRQWQKQRQWADENELRDNWNWIQDQQREARR